MVVRIDVASVRVAHHLGAESSLSCPSIDVYVSCIPHLLHAPWSTFMIF